jgi:hypothetical protein
MKGSTYAIILTSFPRAPSSISRANSSARASIDPDGGTVAMITSIPRAVSASLIPRQYWTPGRYRPAKRNSSNPSRPWARTTGYLGAATLVNRCLEIHWGFTYHIYLGSLSIHRISLCHGPLGAAQDWVWVCMGMHDTICCLGIHMMNMLPMAA